MIISDITKVIDKYHKVRESKLPKIQKFWNNDPNVPFLIVQQEDPD